MRRLAARAVALALTAVAAPATAFLVEATTSVSIEDVHDEAALNPRPPLSSSARG